MPFSSLGNVFLPRLFEVLPLGKSAFLFNKLGRVDEVGACVFVVVGACVFVVVGACVFVIVASGALFSFWLTGTLLTKLAGWVRGSNDVGKHYLLFS